MALVTLRSYRDPIDAELGKARLENAGIPAVILDQHLVSIQWLYSNAVGGVKLTVDESDLDAALQVLGEDRSTDLSNIPEGQAPPVDGDHCPVCGSTDVLHSRLQRIAAAASLATGLPLIAWRRRWICASCDHTWMRDASKTSETSEVTLRAEALVHERRSFPIVRVMIASLLGLAVLWYVQAQIRQL